MSHGLTCPCCSYQSQLLLYFLIWYVSYQCLESILNWSLQKKYTWLHTLLRGLKYLSHATVISLALFLGYLSTQPDLKNYFFFQLAKKMMIPSSQLDTYRCDQFQSVSGRVLEIGPGPGTNFRCWTNNTKITEWVGVEPNPYFAQNLLEEHQKYNLTFPIKTIWIKGEDLDIEPNSFDVVVGAHVLCSVDNVKQVLTQVKRALKPLGTYYFMEHVQEPSEKNIILYSIQEFLQPFLYLIGNGCQFKALWEELTASTGLQGFSVELNHIALPMPISVFSPHIMGKAIKL